MFVWIVLALFFNFDGRRRKFVSIRVVGFAATKNEAYLCGKKYATLAGQSNGVFIPEFINNIVVLRSNSSGNYTQRPRQSSYPIVYSLGRLKTCCSLYSLVKTTITMLKPHTNCGRKTIQVSERICRVRCQNMRAKSQKHAFSLQVISNNERSHT